MKNNNTLYFIHNTVIQNTNFDKLVLDDARLTYMADLVISGNIKIKDRQRGRGDVISDKSIMAEISAFDGIIINRPSKEINNMKNTIKEDLLYFIPNILIKNGNLDISKVDDKTLTLMSNYVILNNIFIKNRNGNCSEFVSSNDIMSFINSFDGVIVSRPTEKNQERQASEEFIQSQITRYMDNQNNIADPIVDSIALELRGLYPKLSQEQSVDWALEFINTDYSCEDIFGRIDNLFRNCY